MNRILGRKKDDREHLIRNLATSLVLFEAIETTEAKAKEVKSFVDQLIARSKDKDLHAIRSLHKVLFDKNAVDKIIKELLPRYESRNSGFIKSYHLKNRVGDNAPMIRLELVDMKKFVSQPDEKKAKEQAKEEKVNESSEKNVRK